MAGLGSLSASIGIQTNTKKAYIILTELDEEGRPSVEAAASGALSRRLQYYPDSIQDSKAVNYQTKEVPGASLPLYQWVNSGERAISFTAVFTTDTDHYLSPSDNVPSGFAAADSPAANIELSSSKVGNVLKHLGATKGAGVQKRNIWIPAAVAWLRSYLLPTYTSTGSGNPLTKPPKKLLLTIPGSYMSLSGGDGGFSSTGGIVCLMTQCEVSYVAMFPSGNPRIAEVQLSFSEVPQLGGAVVFPQARTGNGLLDDIGTLYPLDGRDVGGNGDS